MRLKNCTIGDWYKFDDSGNIYIEKVELKTNKGLVAVDADGDIGVWAYEDWDEWIKVTKTEQPKLSPNRKVEWVPKWEDQAKD